MAGGYAERLLSAPEQLQPVMPAPARPAAPASPSAPPKAQQSYADRLLAPQSSTPPELPAPISSYEHGAGLADIAIASLADDPATRARFYAKQRGLPIERYRIVEDRVAYQDDDDQWYFERPNAMLGDPRTWFQSAAGGAGPSMPIVAGTAAGIATAPMLLTGPGGMAASIGLTAAAGGAGQAAREALASEFLGQEMSPGRIAQQGAVEGLSQGIGGGLTALAQRHAVRDLARLDRPAAEALTDKGARQGIQLTPAEATDLPSLKAQQKMLGNLPQSADTMGDFYRGRAERQIAPAVERNLDAISPVASPELAGQMAREASSAAMERKAAERAAAASPLYKEAFAKAGPVDVSPVLAYIDRQAKIAKGGIAKALTSARSLLTQEVEGEGGKPLRVPESRLEALHQAKLAIDDMLDTARESGMGRTAKRELQTVKTKLLDAMGEDYRHAASVYADLSPGVSKVREGVVGIIADLPDTRLQTAAAKLFSAGQTSVTEMKNAKVLLRRESPEAWQAMKRAWLEDQWQKAGREYVTTGRPVNQGAKFRALVFGDPKQRLLMNAALEPAEREAWKNLADVLEATGRVKPIGSDTAWNQEMMKIARQDAAPWITRALKYLTPDAANEIYKNVTDASLRKNANRLAEIVTSPDGMARLRELKQLDASGAVKRVLVGQIIGVGGTKAIGEAVSPGETGPVQPQQP